MAGQSVHEERRRAAEAIARRITQSIVGGQENADPLSPDQLRLLNGAGFFSRAQVEHFASRIRDADRILEEILASPALSESSGPPIGN